MLVVHDYHLKVKNWLYHTETNNLLKDQQMGYLLYLEHYWVLHTQLYRQEYCQRLLLQGLSKHYLNLMQLDLYQCQQKTEECKQQEEIELQVHCHRQLLAHYTERLETEHLRIPCYFQLVLLNLKILLQVRLVKMVQLYLNLLELQQQNHPNQYCYKDLCYYNHQNCCFDFHLHPLLFHLQNRRHQNHHHHHQIYYLH